MIRQIPNIITFSRLLFLGIIAVFAASNSVGAATWAFTLCVIASLTDWADGFVARKFNLISDFGKIADALIDKFMVVGLYIVLICVGILPTWAWLIVAVTVVRDVIVTVLRMKAKKQGVVLAADKSGKQKTFMQVVGTSILFAVPFISVDLSNWLDVDLSATGDKFWYLGMICVIVAGVLTVTSGYGYMRRYWPLLKGGNVE